MELQKFENRVKKVARMGLKGAGLKHPVLPRLAHFN